MKVLKDEKVRTYRAWCAKGRPRDCEDVLFINYKNSKKLFAKTLRRLSRSYEEEKVDKVIKSAEIDSTSFWKILKRETSGPNVKVQSIKNANDVTVHDIDDILNVWQSYFSDLCTPKHCPDYDSRHFESVTENVKVWAGMGDSDRFTENDFSFKEVKDGIAKLNPGKAPGADGITKEHLSNAGPSVVKALELVFKWVLSLEYIPLNFRTGIQIPLFKGKGTSPLEAKNYRGITLLSTFNKLFEAMLWNRIRDWWESSHVISRLQGACRRGVSCIHTALVLQETVATLLESHSKVYVSYFDVARAFDSVWIDGLFSRMYALGIRGKTWRLLYKTYIGFKCRVRIHDRMSAQYEMKCGIHQGGYLSLLKYIAFINSLIQSLEESNLCASICQIKVSPLGYADDVASVSTSKTKVDAVLKIVFKHSRIWRYDFNAKKSAILVYGETIKESNTLSKDRAYLLGNDQVHEKQSYDHVGLKCCIHHNYTERTSDKVQKGRRALNAASGLGLKPGGISMKACSLLFWSLIVPIVTFASELWVLRDVDLVIIENFQRYAGRRVQRFPSWSPRETSFVALGWIRLEMFVYVKKLLFIRTILVQEETSIYREVFKKRALQFMENRKECLQNKYDSPVFDLLKVAMIFGLYDDVMRMMAGTIIYEKAAWKRKVWHLAWELDDVDWRHRIAFFKSTNLLNGVMNTVNYLTWWKLSDERPQLMRQCEDLSKLVCNCSRLKSTDPRFKVSSPVERMCTLCDEYAIEDVNHVVLHCKFFDNIRLQMHEKLRDLSDNAGNIILGNTRNILHTLLGAQSRLVSQKVNFDFQAITAVYISKMYRIVLKERKGIG